MLITGAGEHGKVVAEIAMDLGYSKIDFDFIDDNSEIAIGKISDIEKYKDQYEDAFVGIGNNEIRENIILKLKKIGFHIPVLIHPSAYVSRSCEIKEGTIVEPKVIVNAYTQISEGGIISVGAIVDYDVRIEKFCHINSGAIVKAGAKVDDYRKLEAGEVVLGYESARVE